MSLATSLKGSLSPGLAQVMAQFGSTVNVLRYPTATFVNRNDDGSPIKENADRSIILNGGAMKMYLAPLTTTALQRLWGKDVQATTQGVYSAEVDAKERDLVSVTQGPHAGKTFAVVGRPIVDPMSGLTVIALEETNG